MIDLALVAAFVVYALVAGLRSRREASRGLVEYFLAGRRLGAWRSGLSMTATQYAADTPLLAAGLVATGGVFALWRLWIYGIAFLLLGFLLAAPWWRSGVLTDAEFCELRYQRGPALALRTLKAVYYGLVFNCAVLAMVLVAAVRIAEPFLLWDAWLPASVFEPLVAMVSGLGVPLASDPDASDVWVRTACNLISVVAIYGFTALYSATGGLRSVVATDLVQLGILALATLVYAVVAVDAAGGLAQLPDALAETVGAARSAELLAFDPLVAVHAGSAFVAVLGLQWLVQMNSDGSGYLAQRCLACSSAEQARLAPVIFAYAQVLVRSLLWLPILVALLVVFPLEPGQSAAVRELTFVRGIEELLPPGARGLILVGMLAALASTLDTHLNWGAAYLTNDLYARILCGRILAREPGDRELVWVARLASPVLVLISLGLMARLGSIQEAWHATLLLGAGLGVPLLLRWLWWRMNAWGELAAIVASGVAAPLLLAGVAGEATRLLAVALIGSAASIGAALATSADDSAHRAMFYARVQPPGFWQEPGARRRLTRGLLGAGTCSLSLFGSLVGLGSWLIGATPPLALSKPLWVGLNLGIAVALVPVWWTVLTRPGESETPDPQRESSR